MFKLVIPNLLLSFLLFLPFNTHATVVTGDYFLEQMEESSVASLSFLNGYVAGVYDVFELELKPCKGTSVKMSSLRDAVAKFYRANPSKRQYSVSERFVSIIKKEWDC